MVSPKIIDRIVRDCAEAGVSQIWMYRGIGDGAVSETALEFCELQGIQVVPGYCPYMFLPHPGFFHKAHGFAMKMTGSYPN